MNLWSTAKGMSSDERSSLVLSIYMYCGFNSVGVCTAIINMPLGCMPNALAFQIEGFVVVDGILMHN